MTDIEKYYRYDETLIDSTYDHVEIYLSVFNVIKHTPCGVWLDRPYGLGKRFVLKTATKQFACPTKKLALISFRARKMRQIKIYTEKLKIAKLAVTCEPLEQD